ncbi:hypothetical protein [Nitrosopumilus sp.]|uniref:hypothetical protein n=1 Tax=Nitrosopumilus sp. TaxID=2024843 RepID=UPI002606ACFE|nr:hypothetical protein [Nitrosopumilus sp.]
MKIIPILLIPLILSIGLAPALQYDLLPQADAIKAKGNSLTEINSKKVCGDRLCSEIDSTYEDEHEYSANNESKNSEIDFDLNFDDIELLFVQTANSGTLKKIDGQYVLALNDVSSATAWFTDRPHRLSGTETTQDFIDHWNYGEDNFQMNPPNAAIQIFEADQSKDLVIVELTNPVYDDEKNTLQYNVVILSSASDALGYHSQFADEMIPESFGQVILFIDGKGGCVACKIGLWATIIGLGIATFGAGVGIEDEVVSKIVQKMAAKGIELAAGDIIQNATTKHSLVKFLCYKMHACKAP